MTNYIKELCGLCFVLMLINLTTGAREQLVEFLLNNPLQIRISRTLNFLTSMKTCCEDLL